MKTGKLWLGLCLGFACVACAGGNETADMPFIGAGTMAPPPAGMGGMTAPPPNTGGTGMVATGGTLAPPPSGTGGTSAMPPDSGIAEQDSGTMEPDTGTPEQPDAAAADSGMPMGSGMCCADGDCLCHGDAPSAPTSMPGPFQTDSYDLRSAGCVYFPTNAEPPFAGVAISDGYLGSGGCGALAQTSGWGPLYASWGIVTMIIHTLGSDQPRTRGTKLTAAIAAFKKENETSGSMLFGKMSGRYGTSGFSMGGGGTTFAAAADSTLKTNVSIMAWTPTGGVEVPSLFIFGSSDGLAGTMGMSSYRTVAAGVPKMAITVNAGHSGQPSAGGGESGLAGLAFQKVFLEGDERWLPLLKMVDADDSASIP